MTQLTQRLSLELADTLARYRERLADFFQRRFASQLLHQLPRGADQLVNGLNHVDRDANRTRLISNCTSNRLPNPPRGISGKLIPAAIFEFVHSLHQTDVALLNQIQELQASVGVFLGDRNHEPEVSLDELALGVLRIHVSLDDFALGAFELGKRDSGFGLQFLEFTADGARLTAVFLALLFAARGVRFLFQVLGLAVERT